MLHEPIKELGDYPVVGKLTKNVSAMVNVSVIGEEGTTAADIKARAAGGAAPAAPVAEVETESEAQAESADVVAEYEESDEE